MQSLRFVILLTLLTTAGFAQMSRGRQPRQPKMNAPTELVAADFEGTVRSMTNKELLVETADGNSLQFHLTRKTVYLKDKATVKAAAIEVGMHVLVEGKKAPDNSLDAVRVEVSKGKS